jgi:hypothetical protein
MTHPRLTNAPRNDATSAANRQSCADGAESPWGRAAQSRWTGIARTPSRLGLVLANSATRLYRLLPLARESKQAGSGRRCQNRGYVVRIVCTLLLLLLVIVATTAPAQPVNPLAIVIAQRDAAIRQRDALFAERNALRDERRETLRVCRQHGMPADGDLPTWLGEVLPGGSERAEWAKWFEREGAE